MCMLRNDWVYNAGLIFTHCTHVIENKKLLSEEAIRLTRRPHILAPIKLGIKVADFFLQLFD